MNTILDHEQEQFELLQIGNRTGYNFFYHRHHEGIYYYIRRMGSGVAFAKTLTQEVFDSCWDLRGNLKSPIHLGAYLYVFARQLYLDYARHFQRSPTFDRGELKALHLEPDATKQLNTLCERVLYDMTHAMKGLTTQRRLVLKLLYVNELEVPAVAQMLAISPQTVRNTKAQATDFLRRKLYDRDLLMSLSLRSLLHYMEEQQQ